MRILFAALVVSAATSLAPAPSAQMKFDYITFDRIQLDPDFALLTSTRWGILVNTGTVPISLDNDWEDGLWYAESSEQLGSFFYDLLNPYGNDFIVQPGEAVGDADPMLMALLQPGETFVPPGLLIATFQFGVPFPSNDFTIDFHAQVGDQIAKTRTDVEITDLGGSDFWVPVSARRWTCEPSPAQWTSYGTGCPSDQLTIKPYGWNGGSGPPWTAYWSNMPTIGNWAFGVKIEAPWQNQPYIVGVDTAPGSYPFGSGCEILLGLTPTVFAVPGVMSFFQETQNIPIPDNPALVGVNVYMQALLTNPLLPLSNGVEVTLVDIAP